MFKSSTPPVVRNSFSYCVSLKTVGVPKGAKAAYQSALTAGGYSIGEPVAIKFDANGGKVSATSKNADYGATVGTLPTPTRTGYTFKGWYTTRSSSSGTKISTETTVKSSATYYARWTVNTYKITYKLGNSKAKNSTSNPSTYTYGNSTSLKKPTRSGYVFMGWYTKSNFSSSSKVTSISKTKTGGITLYAKWEKKPSKPTSVKATANSKSKITVTWKKVSGAEGYEVYRATSKNGKYIKVKTVSKGSTVKYANKSLTSNKTYYYKVRAYKLVDGKKVYGEYSAVKSAKTIKK